MEEIFNNYIKDLDLNCSEYIKSKGWDLIHILAKEARKENYLNVLKEYLEKFPEKIDLQNKKGWTPLMLASLNSNTTSSSECVRLLLEKGADPNLKCEHGMTALLLVSFYSNRDSYIETVRLLLEKGADPNLQEKVGWTALMFVSNYSYIDPNMETVCSLLENGADPNLKIKNGKNPCDDFFKKYPEVLKSYKPKQINSEKEKLMNELISKLEELKKIINE